MLQQNNTGHMQGKWCSMGIEGTRAMLDLYCPIDRIVPTWKNFPAPNKYSLLRNTGRAWESVVKSLACS